MVNELADDSQQSLDSQTLRFEVQNLMDEQEREEISERDNFELLLNLTKFSKKSNGMRGVKEMDEEMEEEENESVFKKSW